MTTPMQGVQVVDISQGYESYAGMMLAEFGASVVKVESLDGDYMRKLGPPFIAGESAAFMGVNRGKKSLALAWDQKEEARQVLRRLAARADVFLASLYPDEAEEMGLTYTRLQSLNPRLIYCSITPYGDEGPTANKRASELEMQGMFGHWRYLGQPKFHITPEPPLRHGVPLAAMASAIFAQQGIAAALIHRIRTGEGQKVAVSKAGALNSMRTIMFAAESEPDEWEGHTIGHTREPFHGTQTKDKAIYWGFAGAEEKFPEFLQAMGLADDPRFKGKAGFNLWLRPELTAVIDAKFKEMAAEEVISLIRGFGASAVYMHTFSTMSKDPQAIAMDMVSEFQHPKAGSVKTMGLPWWFSDTPPIVGTPPLLGQHTRQVLEEAGLSNAEIRELFQKGLVGESAP